MLILAPLRGVTVRGFRQTFAPEIRSAGFTEAFTPFISAAHGLDPLKDRELVGQRGPMEGTLRLTPQFIGKDPAALAACLRRVKDAGYDTADLNAGCPFPMVRNKGRGAGLLQHPDVLRQMLEVGCATMGEGCFSLKVRLGVTRNDELLALMPMINAFPLRFLTVHARTARQMYEGVCDRAAYENVAACAIMPVVYNGDALIGGVQPAADVMVGRAFVRYLGERDDATELLARYLDACVFELKSNHAVLGRLKEFVSYWKDLPRWHRLWNLFKVCRTASEFRMLIS